MPNGKEFDFDGLFIFKGANNHRGSVGRGCPITISNSLEGCIRGGDSSWDSGWKWL